MAAERKGRRGNHAHAYIIIKEARGGTEDARTSGGRGRRGTGDALERARTRRDRERGKKKKKLSPRVFDFSRRELDFLIERAMGTKMSA